MKKKNGEKGEIRRYGYKIMANVPFFLFKLIIHLVYIYSKEIISFKAFFSYQILINMRVLAENNKVQHIRNLNKAFYHFQKYRKLSKLEIPCYQPTSTTKLQMSNYQKNNN